MTGAAQGFVRRGARGEAEGRRGALPDAAHHLQPGEWAGDLAEHHMHAAPEPPRLLPRRLARVRHADGVRRRPPHPRRPF